MAISNLEFLEQYETAGPVDRTRMAGGVILPFEAQLIEVRLGGLNDKRMLLAKDRAEIADQSGDSWHDGAFNENDRDVLALDREQASLRERQQGIVVDYPEEDEERVTLGSRVSIVNGGKTNHLDIVGFAAVHEKVPGAPVPASLEAPLVQQILGKRLGEAAMLNLGGRTRPIEIALVDQSSIRQSHVGTEVSE
jgi:transcription elongation GreA/GreB family factor